MALPAELTDEGMVGWQERFAADNLLLSKYFRHIPNKGNSNLAGWQLWDFTRKLATVVPYSAKGENVALRDREVKAAPAPTVREFKDIPGEHIQWLTAPGDRTRAHGQEAVNGELQDLTYRIWRRHESWRGQIFTDTLTYTQAGHTIEVTVGIPDTHTDDASASWATSTTDIVGDLKDAIILCQQDGGVTPDTLLCNPSIIPYLLANDGIVNLLGDREKTALQTRTITRIPGLNLDVVEYGEGYLDADEAFVPFMGVDKCALFHSDPVQSGLAFVDCKSNDARVGEAHRGLYTHAWVEEQPPAGTLVSAEFTGMPVCMNPEGIFYFTDTTP